MSNTIKLGSRLIKPGSKPYIIAEIGVNHEGSLNQAKKLIELAKVGGADAAKFQSYKASSIASKHSPAYWDINKESTTSQYELFCKYDKLNAKDYFILANHCEKVGIDFVSTPFDDDAVEYLDKIMSFYKIASADITNIPLLRKIGAKCKPVVLSTGASNLDEIALAINILDQSGCKDIVLLHCILNYPTKNENAHLKMITGLKNEFPNYNVGYSDHTLPDKFMTTLVTAYLLGALVIEKHFTHDKMLNGNDHYHSMDVNDLKQLCKQVNHIQNLIGESTMKSAIETESISRLNARRSIVLARDVTAGQKLTEKDLTYKRPGVGIEIAHWDKVIGKKATVGLEKDHIIKWFDLD